MAEKTNFPEGVVPFKLPKLKGKGKQKGLRRLIYLAIIILGVVGIYNMLFVYVQPGTFALKEVKIGVKRGIQPNAYQAGLIFRKPFGMEHIHIFPKTLLVYELTNFPDIHDDDEIPYYRFDKAAHIQTSDGFFVDVDATIIYRIDDPYTVLQTIGPGHLYEDNGIIPKAEPVLKQALGQLTTEEFYNSPKRYEKTLMAKSLLNEQLRNKGLKVEHVLVRYFQYSEEIQKNIEEKKLKDQLVFKNQAEGRAAMEEANLKRIIEEGEAAVRVKLQEGQAYITRKNAEKDLYTRKKHAEADLLIKLAEATRTDLKNKALQKIGSDRLVGLEMAKVLKGLDLIVLPSDGKAGLNPLDLRNALELFEVED
ncbi:SPFH domain-containing protein [bacterium]|nr:SPFH domain-containing protein [candidate division CSSED10-310 bacterium]